MVVTSNANQAPTEYALSYTSTPPPTSQSASTTRASDSAATSATSPSNNVNSDSSGLSIGGIVGIVIGALAGVIALVVVGLVVWRKRSKMNEIESQAQGSQGVKIAQLYGDGMNPQTSSPHTGAMEMLQDTAMVELPSNEAPQELRGSRLGR
jgi:hypothetical protein